MIEKKNISSSKNRDGTGSSGFEKVIEREYLMRCLGPLYW